MSVEICDSSFEEETGVDPFGIPLTRYWNGRKIGLEVDSIAHPVKGYPMQGWGAIQHTIKPMGGSVGGSVEAKTNSDGQSSLTGEVHVSSKDDQGNKISVTAEGNVKNDGNGNVTADGGVKVSVEHEF
jgi:hypothetical protein